MKYLYEDVWSHDDDDAACCAIIYYNDRPSVFEKFQLWKSEYYYTFYLLSMKLLPVYVYDAQLGGGFFYCCNDIFLPRVLLVQEVMIFLFVLWYCKQFCKTNKTSLQVLLDLVILIHSYSIQVPFLLHQMYLKKVSMTSTRQM